MLVKYIIIFIIIILVIFLIYKHKQSLNKSLFLESPTVTDCILITKFLKNIQDQINTALIPNELVDTFVIKLGDKSIQIPSSVQDFTQPLPPGTLPSYLISSPSISIHNQKSTWDSIFFSDGDESINPFQIYLNGTKEVVYSKDSTWPACANIFVRFENLEINNFTLKNLASSLKILASSEPSECKQVSITTRNIKYPFDFNMNPNIIFNLRIKFTAYSGFCDYKCHNPFESCGYECNNVSNPCHLAMTPLLWEDVNASISLSCSIKIHNTLQCDIVFENEITTYLENISIQYSSFDLSTTTSVDVSFDDKFVQFLYNILGGKAKIEKNINTIFTNFINNNIPVLYQRINEELKDQKIYIDFDETEKN